jgi:protein TonB
MHCLSLTIFFTFLFHFYVIAQNPTTDSKLNKTSSQDVISPQQSTDLPFYLNKEIEASFPGGQKAWAKFLQKHLKTNIAEKNKAPKGKYKVFVNFSINKKGKIGKVYCDTKYGYGMEQEVIKISPNWKAGTSNNKPINAKRRQPIIFVVE